MSGWSSIQSDGIWNSELVLERRGDLDSVIEIAILLVNSESGTYFFHQFDGQVSQ
jgi:hypothetical protein